MFAAVSQSNGMPVASAQPMAATKKRTLWNIQDDLLALEELMEETGGDISDPRAEAAFDQFAAELQSDFNRKADGYAGYIAELTARSEARKEESDRLLQRSKIDGNLAKSLKDRLKIAMESLGKQKHETTRYKLSVCKAGGKPSIRIADDFAIQPEKLPEQFRLTVTTVKPDSEKIRAALEAGEHLEFASILEKSTYLRIS